MQQLGTSVKAFLFDLDGCVYFGNELAPGIIEFIYFLKEKNISFGFVSNNSYQTATKIMSRLVKMGMYMLKDLIDDSQIIVPCDYAGEYIYSKYGHSSVYVCGSEDLLFSVIQAGHSVVSESESSCAIVLLGRDSAFSWSRLEKIISFIQRGALFIITNPDLSHPLPGGFQAAETGAIAACVTAVCRITPECIGKPNSFLFSKGMEILKTLPESTVFIGDNPATDILGGKNLGMKTVLIHNKTDPLLVEPDIRINSFLELREIIS